MGQRLILEFQTSIEAENGLALVNSIAAAYWKRLGYTVIETPNGAELIGKKNGQDNPQAARTITWDTVQESPVGTFYFSSLSNEPKFSKGMETLKNSGIAFEEKPFPPEWEPESE